VIAGRVADPSLFVAPIAHHFPLAGQRLPPDRTRHRSSAIC
jgi:hypothetical protein